MRSYWIRAALLSMALAFAIVAALPSCLFAEEAEEAPGWKARVELSFVRGWGNTDSSLFSGKVEAEKETPTNRYYLSGDVLVEESEDVEVTNRAAAEGRVERDIQKRLFVLFTAGYSRDKAAGYDYRAYAGPGAGYTLISARVHSLKAFLALLYNHERFSAGDDVTDDYSSAKATGKYRWQISDGLRFKETADYSVSLEDMDKYFVDSDTALEASLNSWLSVGLNLKVSYQNLLPSSDVEHTDTTFLTTLILDI